MPSADEDEIWHVLLGPGNVQQLSLERLDAYYDAGVVSDDTFVWQKGMKEWKKLASVLAELPEPAVEEQEAPFHVLLEDGSVRVLSLEQIDDFYRLGLVDDDTCLWQEGMTGWETIGSLAGSGSSDDTEVLTNPIAARPHERQMAATNVPSHVQNVAVSSPHRNVEAYPSAQHSQRHAVTSSPPTSRAPEQAVAQPASRNAATAPARSLAQAPVWQSTAPVAMSVAPMAMSAPKRGRAGRFVVGLGAVAALVLVLGRNDALFSVATVTNQGQAYLDTEKRAFGGPLFGTPRAVEKLVAESGGALEPVQSPVVAVRLSESEQPSTTTKPSTTNGPSTAAASNAPSTTKPTTGNPLSGNVAAALLGQSSKTKSAPATARAATPAAANSPRKKNASSSKRAVSGSTNYYDPLNGSL